MSRSILVSTAVYAAIWASRKAGEESEDVILSRILCCTEQSAGVSFQQKPVLESGFYDRRNAVSFPAGFRISRIYKGQKFEAEAQNGAWFRFDNGQTYRTLNRLNGSIAAGAENVWNGSWTFQDENGQDVSIDRLRNYTR